jgi:hypothetical protein
LAVEGSPLSEERGELEFGLMVQMRVDMKKSWAWSLVA